MVVFLLLSHIWVWLKCEHLHGWGKLGIIYSAAPKFKISSPIPCCFFVCVTFLFLLFLCFAFFSYILTLLSGPCFRDHIVADSKQKQGFEGVKGTLLAVLKYVLASKSSRRMCIARSNPRGRHSLLILRLLNSTESVGESKAPFISLSLF